ncbi:MAG: biopolymer transporter ExbD [Gammaproteobacteria bacterium]|nr:biopolymer transporter ExbD [Gammaproteobacteria bacterium]
MKFQKKPREDVDLNLTPLIDVVFLLLIFFMVSTTFQKESEITVQLPSATQAPVDLPPEQLEVVINAVGRFYLNDQELVKSDSPSLQAALSALSGGRRDIPLTIRADAKTPHQHVVTAMDAAAQLGMLKMSIATSFSQ